MSKDNLWPWKELVLPVGVDNAQIIGAIHAVLNEGQHYQEVGVRGVRFGPAIQLALFAMGNARLLGSFADEGVLLLKIARKGNQLLLAIVQYPYPADIETLSSMTQSDAADLLEKLEAGLRATLER